MHINTIYRSIDGEPNGWLGVGQQTVFVRTQSCNLNCSFCDSTYATSLKGDWLSYTPERLLYKIIDAYDIPKLTITGGEPLLQNDLVEFIRLFHKKYLEKTQITIETNGSIELPISLSSLWLCIRYIVDYKTPSSRMQDRMLEDRFFLSLKSEDIIKFVISDEIDYDFAIQKVKQLLKSELKARIVFSPAFNPVFYSTWPTILADKIISEDELSTKIQYNLQIHKILWPHDKDK